MSSSLMRNILSPKTDAAFSILHKTIPEGSSLMSWDTEKGPHQVLFDEAHDIVVLHEKTPDNFIPWMSDTPFEINTAMPFAKLAHGDVLIGGLGLGMVPTMLNYKRSINSITVIEQSETVINLVASQLNIPRMKIVQGDIWEYMDGPLERQYDCIWGDIWDSWNRARKQGPDFLDAATDWLKPKGFVMHWLDIFWGELEADIDALLEHVHSPGFTLSDRPLVIDPCKVCAKVLHLDVEGFCLDCADFLVTDLEKVLPER